MSSSELRIWKREELLQENLKMQQILQTQIKIFTGSAGILKTV